MKLFLGAVCLAAAASSALAQAGGGMAGMNHDADVNTKQVGPLPAGWTGRTDRGNLQLENASFVTMGPGFHVSTGPAVTLWNPANTASGTYTITANFSARSMPAHDAYGLVWGGQSLDAANESYYYFLVFGDGHIAVKHRAGASETRATDAQYIHTIFDSKTAVAGVTVVDSAGKGSSNALEVRVGADSVRLTVNGKQVYAADAKNLGGSGIYGIRVNHNINVHVAGFAKK
jgi:hypothetical protein